MEQILFLTGKLAERGLERILQAMQPADFTYRVLNIGVNVAALMSAECREGFTVTVNTVMEDSHIPLNKWLIAFYMMCASKTQISALQFQRHLELGSYRSAWFLCQRIRFALKDAGLADKLAGTVKADDTYIGGRRRGRGYVGNKAVVVSLDGTHHRVSGKYLPLYLAEIDYKYNTRKASDGARTASGIKGVEGKRLMLRRPKAPGD